MKCPFRKTVKTETHDKNGASGKYGETVSSVEEWADCYQTKCMAYVRNGNARSYCLKLEQVKKG